MHVFRGTSVNDFYVELIDAIMARGVEKRPRGTVTRELRPVTLELVDPRRRLVTAHGRPNNVAFFLAELVWILTGRNDVGFLEPFNSQISQYSDDGSTFNAAYGHRLRLAFGHDQLLDVIRTLRDDKDSRQAELVIADPRRDRGWKTFPDLGEPTKHVTKDRACNVMALLSITDNRLDWMQLNRSNDVIWGVTANFMQWPTLMEYVALEVGVELGVYTHVTNSAHIYDHHFGEAEQIEPFDIYSWFDPPPLMSTSRLVLTGVADAIVLLNRTGKLGIPSREPGPFWSAAMDVMQAHRLYREGKDSAAFMLLSRTDPVLGASHMRFCFHHRWRKPEHASRMKPWLRDTGWPEPVQQWIIGGGSARGTSS